MKAKHVRIVLPYEPDDLKSFVRYAKAYDVERDGRYDVRKPPSLNIWTHNLGTTAGRRPRWTLTSTGVRPVQNTKLTHRENAGCYPAMPSLCLVPSLFKKAIRSSVAEIGKGFADRSRNPHRAEAKERPSH
jgi:hypothetical protein